MRTDAVAVPPSSRRRGRARRTDVELVSEDAIVRQLARMLPQLRNELAHGTTLPYTEGVRRVERCADVINQLFDRPTA